jgi:hypothetical protein
LRAGRGEVETFRQMAQRLTCIAGVAGLPQISVQAGLFDECPSDYR